MMSRETIKGPDGNPLEVYETGRADGPALILSNGLGGNIIAWRHFVRFFETDFRIISWDYRGLYKSGPAPEGSNYSIPKHCEDLRAVLSHKGVTKPILVGWSMGVQVNLEFLRQDPEGALAMIAINGTYGRPFTTAFHTDALEGLAPSFFDLLKGHWEKLSWVRPYVRQETIVRLFARALQTLGIAGHHLDMNVFVDLADEWVDHDIGIYAEIFDELARHDAGDLLSEIQIPTLLIAGERDRFTPAACSEHMLREIPDAELLEVEASTHFTPIEFPDLVQMRTRKFLQSRQLYPTPQLSQKASEAS